MSNVEIFDTTFAMTILVIMAFFLLTGSCTRARSSILLLRALPTNAVWLTFPVRQTNAIR